MVRMARRKIRVELEVPEALSWLILRDDEVREYIARQNERLLKAEKKAITDSLTGVYSRAHFDQTLPESVSHSHRANELLSLVLFDIDGFKGINDLHGHMAGDEVLRYVGKALWEFRGLRRPSDMPFRYGGDELGILLPGTSMEGAEVYFENLLAYRPWKVHYEGNRIQISLSAGIAAYPADLPGGVYKTNPPDHEMLVKVADRRLYESKRQNGRGRS